MRLETLKERIFARKITLALALVIGASLAVTGSLFMELKYRTSSTFIVIQEQRFADAFTQAKSAEYLAGIMSRIVGTDSFRGVVMNQEPVLASYLPGDATEARKTWHDTVEVRSVGDTGIITISAYHAVPEVSTALVSAIGKALTATASSYLGQTSKVELAQIDGPIISEFPVRPNIFTNGLAGALVSLIVVGGLVALQPTGAQLMPARRGRQRAEVLQSRQYLAHEQPQMQQAQPLAPDAFEAWLKTGRFSV
jgi:capsular polysaccharide biosynthesis protein